MYKIGDKILTPSGYEGMITLIEDEKFYVTFHYPKEVSNIILLENEMTKVKTAHDRLLDDGWRVVYRDEKTIRYQQVNSFGIRTLIISLYYKTFKIQDDYATLEIAELIVDYLKELKEGSNV